MTPNIHSFTRYIWRAAFVGERISGFLHKGHLFPVVLPGGGREDVALTAPRMVTALQGHLRAAGLPSKLQCIHFAQAVP